MANKFKDLLIRLGIDDKQFQSQLTKVDRQLIRFSNNAQKLGKSLTTNVTLPLTLAAGAAVKTFADFDRLEKGLDVFADTSTSGAEELEKLLDIVRDARTTLDLKSAASASLQLQAVGISADRARETIKQLGIAATVSGSQAEDIGEITRQFAQALSVGRVLEQDLRIIKSRIPAIGKVLQDEFGTVTAEGLRAANISADEFVDRLTNAIATNQQFQNVQISLAKAIETFSVNMQVAASRIGELISKTLDLPSLLESITTQIDRFTVFLNSLNETQKRAVVQIGIFIAALGPVVFIVSSVYKSLFILSSAIIASGARLLSFVGFSTKAVLSLRLLSASTITASRAVFILSAAIKTTVLPLAILTGVVLGAKYAYDKLVQSIAKANRGQDAVRKAQLDAKDAVKQNREELDEYISVLENENASHSDKEKALNTLNDLTDNAFAGVRILETGTEGLTKAQNNYFDSLSKTVQLKKLRKEQTQLREEIYAINTAIKNGTKSNKAYTNSMQIGAYAGTQFAASLQDGGKNARSELKQLGETIKVVEDRIRELLRTQTLDKAALEVEKLKAEVSEFSTNLAKDLQKADVLGSAFNTEKIDLVKEKLGIVKKAFEAAYDNETLRANLPLQDELLAKIRNLETQLKALENATFFADLNKELTDIQRKGETLGITQQLISQEQLDALQQGLEKAISLNAPLKEIDRLKGKIDELRTSLAGNPVEPIDARSSQNIKTAVVSLDDMGGYYANINGKIKEVNKETYELSQLTKKAQESSKDVELNWDKVLQTIIDKSS